MYRNKVDEAPKYFYETKVLAMHWASFKQCVWLARSVIIRAEKSDF